LSARIDGSRSQNTLAKTVQWWKHLRPYWKRRQQRRERVTSAKLIRAEWPERITNSITNRGQSLLSTLFRLDYRNLEEQLSGGNFDK
jgi:hypothetical protein